MPALHAAATSAAVAGTVAVASGAAGLGAAGPSAAAANVALSGLIYQLQSLSLLAKLDVKFPPQVQALVDKLKVASFEFKIANNGRNGGAKGPQRLAQGRRQAAKGVRRRLGFQETAENLGVREDQIFPLFAVFVLLVTAVVMFAWWVSICVRKALGRYRKGKDKVTAAAMHMVIPLACFAHARVKH
jgi:hypothetical protein